MGLGELVGGYGVAECTLAALDYRGLVPSQTRAVVQGFGSMGGATARYLARAGVKVVGIADKEGLVHNPQGLDVETLLLSRDSFGVIDRAQLRDGDEKLPGDQWLQVEAEVLVPAAMSYVITAEDVDHIKAQVVAEAANVATLAEAEQVLRGRGVTVLPDFVANVGTNAWWWWVAFGDIAPTPEASFAKLTATLRPLTREMLSRADREGLSAREAATLISHEKRALIDSRYPTTVKAEAVTR